jgi:glycosyltransferase involved in cell wall biosynthesis
MGKPGDTSVNQLLVSAIMPVYGQREMAEIALASFLSQDWPNKELLVIDDSPDPMADLFPIASLPVDTCVIHTRIYNNLVRYIRVVNRMKIGPKRNLACDIASGGIIVHFDSDDWSAPNRITDQVERLLTSGKAVSGYHSMLFWDGVEAFKYNGSEDYSLGSALCYRKSFWQKHEFVIEDHRRWEDNVFVQAARNDNEIVAIDAGKLMVARIHPGNTCPKKPRENPRQWAAVEASEIPQGFFATSGKAASIAL